MVPENLTRISSQRRMARSPSFPRSKWVGHQDDTSEVVAEEMGASWDDVVVIDATDDGAIFGLQGAGGSTSVPLNFDKMRKMGASAEMLIGAAAEALEVSEMNWKQKKVRLFVSGVALTFGQPAAAVRNFTNEFLSFKDTFHDNRESH